MIGGGIVVVEVMAAILMAQTRAVIVTEFFAALPRSDKSETKNTST